ncbi:hypothetical protein PAMP_000915 [Pampus punctatissimus]
MAQRILDIPQHCRAGRWPGPSPGWNVGGDTPNEDEYSAALERLLEGCPARTRCSSQIGGRVRVVEGGARHAGLKWGRWVVEMIGVADMQERLPLAADVSALLLPGGEGRWKKPAAISGVGYCKCKEKKCGAALPSV